MSAVLKPSVGIVSEDALKPILPFEQRCGHQIFAVEVKQVEQEEHEAASTGVSRVLIRANDVVPSGRTPVSSPSR
jgi:hypothetical protein